jgi:hypothetical protein
LEVPHWSVVNLTDLAAGYAFSKTEICPRTSFSTVSWSAWTMVEPSLNGIISSALVLPGGKGREGQVFVPHAYKCAQIRFFRLVPDVIPTLFICFELTTILESAKYQRAQCHVEQHLKVASHVPHLMSFDGQPPYIDPRRRPKGCQMDGLVIHDSFDVKMPSTTDYAVVQCKHEQLYLDVLTCNVEDKAFIRPRRRELDDSPVITCF